MKRKYFFLLFFVSMMWGVGCDLESEGEGLENLLVTMEEIPNLSVFSEAVALSDFSPVAERGIVTLFAPNNQAMDAFMQEKGYASVSAIPKDTLENMVSYHIVPGVGRSGEIVSGYYSTNSPLSPNGGGVSLLIEVSPITLVLNNSVEATRTDIEGTNGVIHIVNGVLLPPSVEETYGYNSALSIMKNALDDFGLLDSLKNGRNYTIFTPPNDAITNYLNANGLAGISDLSPEAYRELIFQHIIEGNNNMEALLDGTWSTLSPMHQLSVRLGNSAIPDQSFFLVNDSTTVLLADVQATDGILHIVDRVLP